MTRPLPPEPQIVTRPGRVDFHWEEGIHIAIRRLHRHREGRVTGHLIVRTEAPLPMGLLHRGDLNLSATRSKKELAKTLDNAPPLWDWGRAVELICDRTLNRLEEGDPVKRVLVDPEEELPPPAYLLHPLMPLGLPTIIYGDGGTLKSTLAIALALCALLPWENNPFGLVPPAKPMMPLYLDWEMDEATFKYRLYLLLRGHGLPAVEIPYRRCYLPLAQDLEHIQDIAIDTGARWLILDSLGAAVGGNLNETEGALAFFQSLRQINLTALTLAHTAKDKEGDRGVYGSAFFRNYARSVWETRKDQEVGSSRAALALIDRKTNLSGTRQPLGYQFQFDDPEKQLVISHCDPHSIAGVLERLGVKSQILSFLKTRPHPVGDIIEAIGKSKATQVRNRLSELKSAGLIVLLPDKSWGLALR